MSGQRAIVTGANRGIGRGLALALASTGADVALGARDERVLGETRAAVAELGVRAVANTLDVSSASSITEFVDSAVEQVGGLDIGVDNASVLTGVRTSQVDARPFAGRTLRGRGTPGRRGSPTPPVVFPRQVGRPSRT